jgi:ribonuclease HI
VTITIYTDGACTGNPGAGGYAAIILADGKRRSLSGGFRQTTNNRMELMAVIAALRAVDAALPVRLFTDSQYVADAINLGWAEGWRKRGWRKANRQPAENADLWQDALVLLAGRRVTVEWVRGHAGEALNRAVDRLAVRASQSAGLEVDTAFEQGQTTYKMPTLFD